MQKEPERMPKYSATGATSSMLSGRLSSWFDLRGPSVTIDTACSSSLVALDQACRTLRLGKAAMVSDLLRHTALTYKSEKTNLP